MEERLACKPRLLEFDEAPLAEIVAEFNRRLSAPLRSDNVEGIVRLQESDFAITASRERAGIIALASP